MAHITTDTNHPDGPTSLRELEAYEGLPKRSLYCMFAGDGLFFAQLIIVLLVWRIALPLVFPYFPTYWYPMGLGGEGWSWIPTLILYGLMLSSVADLLLEVMTWRSTGILISDDVVSLHQGVFTKQVLTFPRSRVQSIEMAQGPIQSLFKVGTITIRTAGIATPEMVIRNLDIDNVTHLNDLFTNEIQERLLSGPVQRKRAGAQVYKPRKPAGPKPEPSDLAPAIKDMDSEMARSARWYTAPITESTQNSWKAVSQAPVKDPAQAKREASLRQEQIRQAQLRAQAARRDSLQVNAGDEAGALTGADGTISGGESPILIPPISTDERQQRRWQHSQWGVVYSEDVIEDKPQELSWSQEQFLHPELNAKTPGVAVPIHDKDLTTLPPDADDPAPGMGEDQGGKAGALSPSDAPDASEDTPGVAAGQPKDA